MRAMAAPSRSIPTLRTAASARSDTNLASLPRMLRAIPSDIDPILPRLSLGEPGFDAAFRV
jgi:hypothetical protein